MIWCFSVDLIAVINDFEQWLRFPASHLIEIYGTWELSVFDFFICSFNLFDEVFFLSVGDLIVIFFAVLPGPECNCVDLFLANPTLLVVSCELPPLARAWQVLLVTKLSFENQFVFFLHCFQLGVDNFLLVLADEHVLLEVLLLVHIHAHLAKRM